MFHMLDTVIISFVYRSVLAFVKMTRLHVDTDYKYCIYNFIFIINTFDDADYRGVQLLRLRPQAPRINFYKTHA